MNRERIKVLIIDDEESVREPLAAWLEKDGYSVATAPDGASALATLKDNRCAIALLDLKMPGMDGLEVLTRAKELQPDLEVVMMTAFATVTTAVQAIKGGAYDYLVKPFDPEELSLTVDKIAVQQELRRENRVLRSALRRKFQFREMLSKSASMQAVVDVARSAARSHSTVLILGESGTGKELMARAIHAESDRAEGPFVAVSCAALTETLLESELFGHEKGSFTGAAARRLGKIEAASKGTLFLDEIGDISPKLQLDLLRVLEERRFMRVGGNDPIAADVRFVAATNRDLPAAVKSGAFRDDLFYRLNVIPIALPPLRQRREDIPLLVDHFLDRLAVELNRPIAGLSGEAMALIMSYGWPGNVRELRNVLERGAVVSAGKTIEPAHLGISAIHTAEREGGMATMEEVERRHLAFVLQQSAGNVTQAARVLGIDRATLYNKIKKYELRRADGVEKCDAPVEKYDAR